MSSAAQLAMMDPQGRVPPAQTVYSDLLGVSYPARKRQVEFSCSNGDSFDTSGKNTCEIPLAVGTGEWLDLSNSYFKITIKNKSKASNGTTNVNVCYKLPHDIIERLQILGTNSEMIEDVQNYNVLARLLTLHQLGEDGLTYNTGLGECQKSTLQNDFVAADMSTASAGSPTDAELATMLNQVTGGVSEIGMGSHHGQLNNVANASKTGFGVIKADESLSICFPLISGITSTNKYLPVGMLKNRSLSLRVTLARAIKAFAVGASDSTADVSYSNVAFVADVITMAETYNEKFQNMLRSIGDISIHYTTYKNYQDAQAASDLKYNGLIPDSSRSLKSIFTTFIGQEETANTDALQMLNPDVTQYQYTILSDTYPQSDVTVGKTNRNQAFANLHIALGQLGSITSRCTGSIDSYYNSTATEANSSTFALGVCCESHNKSSNLLESGISLQNSTQPCRLTATLNAAAALNVNHFTLSDRLLMIDADGNLRSSG